MVPCTMWYEAAGKEKGQDPYFTHLYRIGLGGKNNVSLTPGNGTHTTQISPDGKYVIDTVSQPDVAPETVLRDVLIPYLHDLGDSWQRYVARPGRNVTPLSELSFEAWIKQ